MAEDARPRPFTGAVLAGGSSRRMGRDKAFVEVDGRALVTIARDALRGAGAGEVLAVGGDGSALATHGLVPVADQHPGEGPLGALLTAFEAATHQTVVVLACDLPGVVPDAVRAVLRPVVAGAAAAAIAVDAEGRDQPLLGAWSRSRAAPALAAAFAAGGRSLTAALASVEVHRVTVPSAWVRNANTPADVDATRQPRPTEAM